MGWHDYADVVPLDPHAEARRLADDDRDDGLRYRAVLFDEDGYGWWPEDDDRDVWRNLVEWE